MGSLQNFLSNLNMGSLIAALLSAAAALVCITFHELSHGFIAYRLGDPTAKKAGRLTLNPVRHIDLLGLLLMITAHVGWAKPVPVDPRYFRRPKRDMALTALAGPVSNFLLAFLFLLACKILLALGLSYESGSSAYIYAFLCRAALLSIGLGVFNLFPVPPLDGSKILFSFLPDKYYLKLLRFERYGMLVLLAVVWLGVLDKPLSFLIFHVFKLLCTISAFPLQILYYCL